MGDVLLHLTISKQKKKVAVPEINEAQQLTHLYFKEWENPAEYFMVAWPPDCPHVKISHRKPHGFRPLLLAQLTPARTLLDFLSFSYLPTVR